MKNANDIAFTAQKDVEGGDGIGIEQQKEVNSVYKDLLRGELTQEVIELRHEMYFAERLSHKYSYGGNGRAIKNNHVFDYQGKLETSDGLPLLLVQDNKEDQSTLADFEIFSEGENVFLGEKATKDLRIKTKKDFTIKIERDFICTFRLEQYATKIVVKTIDDTHSLLDIYVSQYREQFNNVHTLFLAEINKIYQGDTRSDVIDFNNLSFTTYNAYGVDDLITFKFNNIKFDNIIKFDGSYVLRFTAENEEITDILDEMYDEKTAKKCENHEMREGAVISAETFLNELQGEQYDSEQANELLTILKNERKD